MLYTGLMVEESSLMRGSRSSSPGGLKGIGEEIAHAERAESHVAEEDHLPATSAIDVATSVIGKKHSYSKMEERVQRVKRDVRSGGYDEHG